jgi:hypothetical protein
LGTAGLSLGLGGAALLLLLLLRRRPAIWLGPVLGLVAIAIVLRDVAVLRVPAPFGNKTELPDAAQARAVFEPLHANIYRAFDYSKEGDIYDALARSVEGEYLEQLYRQVYESLVMRDEGGAMSRVQSVEQLSFELLGTRHVGDQPALDVEASWRVKGAVFHWGHDHVRVHDYDARYTLLGTEQGWRIAQHEVLGTLRKPMLESLETQIPLLERDDSGR